jgi:hypothetical protein
MVDSVLDEGRAPIDPERHFGEQVAHREAILYRHHVTSDLQWQGQLVAHEPVPEFYESYEAFEVSYHFWASLTLSDLRQPIAQVTHFSDLLGLDYMPPQALTNFLDRNNGFFIDGARFEWATGLMEPTNRQATEDAFRTWHSPMQKRDNRATELYHFFGAGARAKPFVNEMKGFGAPIVTRGNLCHPTGFVETIQVKVPIPQIVGVFRPHSQSINGILLAFLRYDLDADQTDEIMRSENGRTRIADQVIVLLTPKVLRQLFEYRFFSEHHPYRISLFLRSVLVSNASDQLMKMIFLPVNIGDFYTLVWLLLRTEDRRVLMFDLLDGSVPAFTQINRFYLCNPFLFTFRDHRHVKCYGDCLEQMRGLSYQIAHSLKDRQFAERLRNREYIALLILLQCDSPQIHRLLLGPQFLVWLNEQSRDRQGIILYQTIAHGSAMASAGELFMQNGWDVLKAIIHKMTPVSCTFVASLYEFVLLTAESCGIQYRGQKLLVALNSVIDSRNPAAISMLVPIARIFKCPHLISNYSDPTFQADLGGAVAKLCVGMASCVRDVFMVYATALCELAYKGSSLCPVIVKRPEFVEALTARLFDSDILVCAKSWRLLSALSQDQQAHTEVFQNQDLQLVLKKWLGPEPGGTTAPPGVIQLLKFASFVWTEGPPALRRSVGEAIKQSIGSLCFLYLSIDTFYAVDEIYKTLIDKFVKIIKRAAREDASDSFATEFSKHMQKM